MVDRPSIEGLKVLTSPVFMENGLEQVRTEGSRGRCPEMVPPEHSVHQ